MSKRNNLSLVDDRRDEEVWSYIEQLMNAQNCSKPQAHNSPSNESNNSTSIAIEQTDELDSLDTRKVRGPTLLKDIWNMPRGKTIVVKFNNRNQAIGKEGRKLSSFLGIIARMPQLTPLNIDDWRFFDKEEKKKLVEVVRKKFSIPTRGEEFVKKSLGKKWKDYKCELRCTYMTKYKTKDALLKNRPNRIPRDQWIGLVSHWVSDKAKKRSQANRSNRAKQKMPHTGGSKSIGTLMDEKEVKELKELKEKHDEEMNLMKQSQEKLLTEFSFMRQVMCRFFPIELYVSQNMNGSSTRQVPDTNSGHERASKAPQMSFQLHGIDKNIATPHGHAL